MSNEMKKLWTGKNAAENKVLNGKKCDQYRKDLLMHAVSHLFVTTRQKSQLTKLMTEFPRAKIQP